MSTALLLCVCSDLLCKGGLVAGLVAAVGVRRDGVGKGGDDTDLPLINADGDQGERQDDED